jgi:hypothetical protein
MNSWENLVAKARKLSKELGLAATKTAVKIEPEPDFMIPVELYGSTRDNIEQVCKQINRSYYRDIPDGAAVLARKVIEMLLILSFKHFNVEALIKDPVDGNYFELSKIVKEAVQNTTLDLSRNAKEYLEIFREKGNLSAHNPFHMSNLKELERLQPKLRHLFEELLFKSGIRTA